VYITWPPGGTEEDDTRLEIERSALQLAVLVSGASTNVAAPERSPPGASATPSDPVVTAVASLEIDCETLHAVGPALVLKQICAGSPLNVMLTCGVSPVEGLGIRTTADKLAVAPLTGIAEISSDCCPDERDTPLNPGTGTPFESRTVTVAPW
jgi:hypothetical protein